MLWLVVKKVDILCQILTERLIYTPNLFSMYVIHEFFHINDINNRNHDISFSGHWTNKRFRLAK